jgi:hypothetical protein
MEMERSLKQMTTHLLEEIRAGQAKMKSDINAQTVVCQDKVDAEAKAGQDQFKEDKKRPYGNPSGGTGVLWKRDDSLQIPLVVCPEKSKAGPEEMEADMITFKERSHKIEFKDV